MVDLRIPNDEQGRCWVTGEWTYNPELVKRTFVTLVSLDEDGEPQVLGHGFVICASGKNALCLGAAHSFEAVKKVQLSRLGRTDLGVPSVFRVQGPQYINSAGIGALVQIGDHGLFCKVTALNYVEGNDVAAFSIRAPKEREIFTVNMALDLTVPKVGEQVAVLANEIDIQSELLEPCRHHVTLTQQFGVRVGVVSEVLMGRSAYPNQSYIFKTTIPVTAGMSGAPVLALPKPGDAISALGIVSSDMSEKTAHTNFLVAGCSSMSVPFPAMGLALPFRLPEEVKTNHYFLGELLEGRFLDDSSKHVEVRVRTVGNKTQVAYFDKRDRQEFVLKIAGHPERHQTRETS